MTKNKLLDWPHDIGAEGAVIGSLVAYPEYISEVVEYIGEEDFWNCDARKIFGIIRQLWSNKENIDAVLVRSKFPPKRSSELFEFLRKALDTVPSGANAVFYAKIVRKKSQERKIIAAVEKGWNQAINLDIEIEDKIEAISSLLSQMPATLDERDKSLQEIIDELWAHQHIESIPTGFASLDRIIDGLSPGQLILIGAPSSMGKSSLLMDIFIHALRCGTSPYYVSLEMSNKELGQRLIQNVGRVGRHFNWKDDDVMEAVKFLVSWPASISQKRDNKIHAVTTNILAKKRKDNIGVVFVDYLHLIDAPGRSLYEQRTKISHELKTLALKADIPVVVAAQLNRAPSMRTNKRPTMSDLRDSGSLEQEADIILLLYSEDYYRKRENPNAALDGLAECIVAKNRNGPTGVVPMIWFDEYCSFKERTNDDGFNW